MKAAASVDDTGDCTVVDITVVVLCDVVERVLGTVALPGEISEGGCVVGMLMTLVTKVDRVKCERKFDVGVEGGDVV